MKSISYKKNLKIKIRESLDNNQGYVIITELKIK